MAELLSAWACHRAYTQTAAGDVQLGAEDELRGLLGEERDGALCLAAVNGDQARAAVYSREHGDAILARRCVGRALIGSVGRDADVEERLVVLRQDADF